MKIGSEKRILLIADDEPLLLDGLREIASDLKNTEILTAKDGAESLGILLSRKVDAVLSDINMPKKNGLQVLSEIRKAGHQTPYVVITGYSDHLNFKEAKELGVTGFLEKPFQDEELLSILEHALEQGFKLRGNWNAS